MKINKFSNLLTSSEKMKRIILMLSIFILLAYGVLAAEPASVAQGQNIRFANDSEFDTQNVEHTFVNQIPDPAEPGRYVDLRWKIENFGGTGIRDIRAELLPEFPFSLLPGDDGIRKVGSLHARQIGEQGVVIYYRVLVDRDAVEGNNEIRLRYSADKGKSWVRLDPFFVRIQTLDAILAVTSVSSKPENIKPGEAASVNIMLRNYADSLLKDIRFSLDFRASQISPMGSSNEKVIKQIAANEEASLVFRLIADSDAESKVHKIPYGLSYTDNIGNLHQKNGTVGLVVKEEPEFSVNLEDIEIFTKNTKGKVVISVSNIGSSEIKFMSISLAESDDYKVLSAPVVYIGNIESDDFETAEFDVFVESKKKEVPLNVELEYKDSYNQDYSSSDTLILNLYSNREAKRLGLVATGSAFRSFISFVVFVITTVFWLFMLMDLWKNKMKRYQKWLWLALVVLTHVVGAVIYYFLGRKKELGKR